MLRAHLGARKRCYNHPHRETLLTCDRCKTPYCEDCLVQYDGARMCAVCIQELEAAKAAQLTFRERVVQSIRSLGTTLIVAAVVVAVLGGVFFLVRPYFDRPITPEEMARFRYAIAGSFETEEGVNVSSTVLGARVVSATSAAEGYPAKQLINEYTGPGITPWRSADATFPQEIVVEFQDVSGVSKVILRNNPDEPPETYVKAFEVLLSTEGPDTGYKSVGQFQMEQNAEAQRFEFTPTPGRWVKLRILGNYGSSAYTSLDEFNSYVVPANPLASPSAATPAPRK